jgi:hypothetical protein
MTDPDPAVSCMTGSTVSREAADEPLVYRAAIPTLIFMPE